jgi:acyl-CoA synthetase (AMP-forming)/AMP-acid ligase II
MDDAGRLVGSGERGEIVVRGGLVMLEYYKDAEQTSASRAFGWHHTGDIGVIDDEGYLNIVDRKRDMIITGGFNVYPSEIEQVIWSHPSVQDCAVIGVPDEKWGETVKAVVEPKLGRHVNPGEILALCRSRLGGVKAPKSVEVWDQLPRSAVGKVLKREIRERYWVDRARKI